MTTDDPSAPATLLQRALAKHHRDLGDFFLDAATALGINGISGDYVEFGSTGGTTLSAAYDVMGRGSMPRHLWAFDSFAGLPEAQSALDVHPAFRPGFDGGGLDQFVAVCDGRGIPREAYTTVVGYFEETLPAIGSGAPTDIALAYVDCNMHSSTVTVLEFLLPRLKHGMILAFDDYYCWSATEVSGERAAFDELYVDLADWNFLRFKDPTWGGVSFVVEHVGASAPRRRP